MTTLYHPAPPRSRHLLEDGGVSSCAVVALEASEMLRASGFSL
jgi:hypothetical protein